MPEAAPWNGTVGATVPVGATVVVLPVGYRGVVVAGVVVGASVVEAVVAGGAGGGIGRVTPTVAQSAVAKVRVFSISAGVQAFAVQSPIACKKAVAEQIHLRSVIGHPLDEIPPKAQVCAQAGSCVRS